MDAEVTHLSITIKSLDRRMKLLYKTISDMKVYYYK